MDWDDVRFFLAVTRSGSLAKAAKDLKVRHSTVARRLKSLEQELGARLFLRTPDGLQPTEHALGLRGHAEAMERSALELERSVSGSDARVSGKVRVTLSEAFTGFIVKRLAPLRQRYPDLLVEVLSGNVPLDLMRGEADLAMRLMPPDNPELRAKKLFAMGWSMYAAKGYLETHPRPPSPKALDGHAIVTFDETMKGIPGARWMAEHGAGATVALRGNSILSVLNATLTGMGVAVLPCFLGDDEPTLTRLTPEVLGTRDAWLVWPPGALEVKRVEVVKGFLEEVIHADRALLEGQKTK